MKNPIIKDDKLLSCKNINFCSPLTTDRDDCTSCWRYAKAIQDNATITIKEQA